jgi:hypothetical protein
MPFIAFGEPGNSTGTEQQQIIRKHLGRRRRKKTVEDRITRSRERSEEQSRDLSEFLCRCEGSVPAFLKGRSGTDRPMILQPCPSCGKHRIVEHIPDEDLSSLFLGKLRGVCGDPFDALPISSTPYTHSLIRHFVDITAPVTLPLPHLAYLFPNNAAARALIAHDEILLQSALSIAALHRENLQGNTMFSAGALEERGKAIALLNKSLSDTAAIPSDGLIISVTILGSCEVGHILVTFVPSQS